MLQTNSPNNEDSQKYKTELAQREAIERVLKTPDGEKLIEFLGNAVFYDLGVFCDNVNATMYREGRRSILMLLLSMKNMNSLTFIESIKARQLENLERRFNYV